MTMQWFLVIKNSIKSPIFKHPSNSGVTVNACYELSHKSIFKLAYNFMNLIVTYFEHKHSKANFIGTLVSDASSDEDNE